MPPSVRRSKLLLLSLLLFISLLLPVKAQDAYSHGGGLYGSIKDSIELMKQPVQDSICSKYNNLSDRGRFITGACVGFGATRVAIGALEYAGILKEARSEKNEQLLAQTRDYFLRSVDGIRHDIRNQINPKNISSKFKRSMEKDKAGTVGFGTGAFLGFAL
ncbi:hypothetical protein ACHAXR_008131 [Thalassiosira sp. AJA248-18]